MKRKITFILLAINVLLFALMELAGGSTNIYVLDQFGAMVTYRILTGEWWRLITPIFLHIGFAHLFMNSYSLVVLGTAFESMYGSGKFLAIYLLSGIMGNLASFALGDPSVVSAGASTSLYGLFGLGIALILFYKGDRLLQSVGKSFGVIILINIVYSFMSPGIDILGHLGGLVGGVLLGGVFPVEGRRISKVLQLVCGLAFLFIAFALYSLGMRYV